MKLDSVNGGFIFIRWDKKKKEHYVANKLIDPGLYYNLKAAKVIMQKQTNKASFGVDDISIQPPDQEKISEAKWLTKAIEKRNDTMIKVGSEIVKRQKEFLEKRGKLYSSNGAPGYSRCCGNA